MNELGDILATILTKGDKHENISEYGGVTPIQNFVNESNIEQARLQSPNPWLRNATIEDFFNAPKESADIKRRFARFW